MKLNRLSVLVACSLLLVAAVPAMFASDKSDVVDAVKRYLDNLDPNKIQTALDMCDSEVSILDEFSPHEWHGPTACADWWKAELAYNEQSGITDDDAPLGTPQTIDVNGDRAYFVAPMIYTYKKHGKPAKETGTFTVSLHRTSAGWKITGWAYSKEKLE
jgi:SnoaL-like protein